MILLFVLMSIVGYGQVNRFIYEYRFIPDSTNTSEIKKEMMILDIGTNGSTYQSHDNFVADSLMQVEIKKIRASGSLNFNVSKNQKRGLVKYKVTKDYPNYDTFLHERISTDRYKIFEHEKPVWKIFSETEKIGNYEAQKATTSFGGRLWTAWFCTDLPFQDGPYKFYGLPGLIIKIEDASGSHRMELVANKKVAVEKEEELPQSPNSFSFGMGKELSIDETQFKKVWKDYINDPGKFFRQMASGSGTGGIKIVSFKSTDGKTITDPNEMAREVEKRVKEETKKNNNRIELSLY